ncbi:hypothetical protein Bbelb_162380 [Branchiostoma belcheri]|nr:hypothetical protein Bbelb_162380 [Branchiostoma belcheri]
MFPRLVRPARRDHRDRESENEIVVRENERSKKLISERERAIQRKDVFNVIQEWGLGRFVSEIPRKPGVENPETMVSVCLARRAGVIPDGNSLGGAFTAGFQPFAGHVPDLT